MDKKQVKSRYKKERKLSLMFVVVVFVFLLCWMPAIIYDYSGRPGNNATTGRAEIIKIYYNPRLKYSQGTEMLQ